MGLAARQPTRPRAVAREERGGGVLRAAASASSAAASYASCEGLPLDLPAPAEAVPTAGNTGSTDVTSENTEPRQVLDGVGVLGVEQPGEG